MNDDEQKVISLTSRRPWQQEQQEQAEAAKEEAEIEELKEQEAKNEYEKRLREFAEDVLRLVVNGTIDSLIVVGQNAESGLFYTDLLLPTKQRGINCTFGFIGALETLSLELKESASVAPCILSDGKVIDPNEAPELDGYEEYDE